ncbi:MAG TPA: C39 family peptidase [Archangium sp.]|jgi:hypothetical protein|uniref:C39 family peptidase n=1 Tax=Archangium sp. TaxID=1872627 RepID=UPI002ED89398
MSRIGGPFRQVQAQILKNAESAASAATPKAVATPKAAILGQVKDLFSAAPSEALAGTNHSAFAGPYGRAPSGVRKLSPNDLGVLPQDQGNTNACGTTSLANVMSHWGMPRTHDQIDNSIRAFDLFTAPDKLVEYARDNGLNAQIKNDATIDDIAKMVDQGVPPIVLMDPGDESDLNLHYVTVSGYNRDANGKITDVVIADSAGGERYTMPIEEFQQKWDNLKMKNLGTGFNNVMITTVPKDGRMITGGDGVQRSASDIRLPKSSVFSTLKSMAARGLANLFSNGALLAEKVWNGAKAVGEAVVDGAKAVVKGAKKLFKKLFG